METGAILMTADERADRLTILEVDVARLIRVVDGENDGEINPGIIGVLRRTSDQVKTNAADIESLERTIDRAKWTMAGIAFAGSALGGAVVFLLTQWLGAVN